jgi:hypothetical protein
MKRSAIVFAAALLAFTHQLAGQEFRASISGQVADSSGAAVTGALSR